MKASNVDEIARACALLPREVRAALRPLPDDAPNAAIAEALALAAHRVAWARAQRRGRHTPVPDTPLARGMLDAEMARIGRELGVDWSVLRSG